MRVLSIAFFLLRQHRVPILPVVLLEVKRVRFLSIGLVQVLISPLLPCRANTYQTATDDAGNNSKYDSRAKAGLPGLNLLPTFFRLRRVTEPQHLA